MKTPRCILEVLLPNSLKNTTISRTWATVCSSGLHRGDLHPHIKWLAVSSLERKGCPKKEYPALHTTQDAISVDIDFASGFSISFLFYIFCLIFFRAGGGGKPQHCAPLGAFISETCASAFVGVRPWMGRWGCLGVGFFSGVVFSWDKLSNQAIKLSTYFGAAREADDIQVGA